MAVPRIAYAVISKGIKALVPRIAYAGIAFFFAVELVNLFGCKIEPGGVDIYAHPAEHLVCHICKAFKPLHNDIYHTPKALLNEYPGIVKGNTHIACTGFKYIPDAHTEVCKPKPGIFDNRPGSSTEVCKPHTYVFNNLPYSKPQVCKP